MNFQHIETLKSPAMYSANQLQQAYTLALLMDRGKFVLCERPER